MEGKRKERRRITLNDAAIILMLSLPVVRMRISMVTRRVAGIPSSDMCQVSEWRPLQPVGKRHRQIANRFEGFMDVIVVCFPAPHPWCLLDSWLACSVCICLCATTSEFDMFSFLQTYRGQTCCGIKEVKSGRPRKWHGLYPEWKAVKGRVSYQRDVLWKDDVLFSPAACLSSCHDLSIAAWRIYDLDLIQDDMHSLDPSTRPTSFLANRDGLVDVSFDITGDMKACDAVGLRSKGMDAFYVALISFATISGILSPK